jgi:hypothetical protein
MRTLFARKFFTRSFFAAAAATVVLAGSGMFSGCSMPTADDFQQRGRTSAFLKDTSDYRAMDNAIYDVLAETYGADRITMVEAPEREHHRWVATSDQDVRGDRHRVRVEGRPMWDSDERYSPQIMVRDQFYLRGNPFAVGSPPEFGGNPWIEGGRDDKQEAKIANAVEAKLRAWRAAGCPEPGNRRDEWLKAKH